MDSFKLIEISISGSRGLGSHFTTNKFPPETVLFRWRTHGVSRILWGR